MSFSVAYTTAKGREIRKILEENPDLRHLLPEIQFIGDNMDDKKALNFLNERLVVHLAVAINTSPRYRK